MDPLTLSGAFATIVGLLANFKAERSSTDLSDFMLWLRESHQEQLADAIAQNRALSAELTSLLATNHQELISRLNSLNERIAHVAFQVEGFAGIATLFASAPELSPQAQSVLKQIVESGAQFVLEHKLSTGKPTEYIFMGGAVGQVQCDEPAFVEEDFASLVAAGLLRLEHTSKGSRKFFPTRAGLKHVQGSDG